MSLKVSYAAASGGMVGALSALAVCILRGIAWEEAAIRILVVAMASAWMAMLLAWLNLMLEPVEPQDHEHESSS